MLQILAATDQVQSRFSSDDIKADYDKDGVVLLSNVLTQIEVALLRQAVDRQFANRQRSQTAYDFQELANQFWREDAKFSSKTATRFDLEMLSEIVESDLHARPLYDQAESQEIGTGAFFYEAAGWRTHPEIREVAFDSNLPEISAQLLDSDYVNFWEDTTFIKTPGATLRTPFHQDYTYFQVKGAKCCVAWIPLDEVGAENGALQYIVGSHRWGQEYAPSVFVSQSPLPDSPHPRLPDIESCLENYDVRTISARPGDVIVHDVMTIHGARGNCTTDRPRRGISFRYCGDDIRYCDKPGAMKQPWVHNPPKNGDRLYSKDYPRVWPKPFPGACLSRLYE
ncbi:phytanoyl-CoA dioxygenase family protein [Hyphococcus sp.]|uniref:phytanoyl-CoA dioxygenase family protein n=1 Tax=Hyphococcus sp. TaxID=2038636 RepID=UPI0020822243|nr:MAG: hypothetical protein DHS20C04_18100 [Marinicaulis sp.]